MFCEYWEFCQGCASSVAPSPPPPPPSPAALPPLPLLRAVLIREELGSSHGDRLEKFVHLCFFILSCISKLNNYHIFFPNLVAIQTFCFYHKIWLTILMGLAILVADT
ncbi:hypothetical protein ABZP36_000706 [Zizania latifolia]